MLKKHTLTTSTALALAAVVATVGAQAAKERPVTAAASSPAALHDGGDQHDGVGQADGRRLQAGRLYAATAFALPLTVRPPDRLWEGIQLRSGRFRFVQLSHLRSGGFPNAGRGSVTLEAAKGPSGSVEETVARLRATPHVRFGAVASTRVAGFAGEAFDATIVGSDNPPVCKHMRCAKGVSFAPFGTNHHCIYCRVTMHGKTLDVKVGITGQLFRIIVVGVRGKPVVIYLESMYPAGRAERHPPSQTFPTFLPQAQKLLAALRFPAK